MTSKKRIIEDPQREDQAESEDIAGPEESLAKDEQDMDVIPEDDPFETPPYEPPSPGEGP